MNMAHRTLTIFLIILLVSPPALCFFGDSIADSIQSIRATVLVFLTNLANNLCRLYEKYILRIDEVVFDTDTLADAEYDFIVVGAGSAGCVMGNRLSEISDWKILVLEAGQPETAFVDIPLLAMGFQGGIYDWAYLMEEQPNVAFGLKDRRMDLPRGKGLGGSSLLNFMIYARGSAGDFDKWAEMGNEGWSFADVLPYYMKSEGANLTSKIESQYHNRDGPLTVENTYQSLLVDAILSGGEEIGLPYIDYNAPVEPFGFSPVQSTTQNGRRFSTARAYLAPVAHRPNLDIITDAFVTNIMIDSVEKRAYGVQYQKAGNTYTVYARKEVILSAGAINSPQLLMLSGIGPKKHLADVGIPCIKDLPVGQHLIDHLAFYGLNFLIYFDWDQVDIRYALSIPEFVKFSKGPFTTLGGVEAVGFFKTEVAKYKENIPDVEVQFMRGSIGSDHGVWMKRALRISDEVYKSAIEPIENLPCWCAAPVLLLPKSEGEVKLLSADPFDHPRIIPKYFTDEYNEDIKTMVAGIRVLEKLVNTTAFRTNGAKISEYPIAGCEHFKFDSFEYWECALRAISHTLYHPMGTCRMGPPHDPSAVVNNQLQVNGIAGLRVVDVSIIPMFSAHTNAPAVMIAEKASDMIKRFHGRLN
uniref:Putative salicyl alcohol oxidase-like n=1 Tax=Phaedon cochleariae TaxID=80249 RepID=W4VSH7_PHACE